MRWQTSGEAECEGPVPEHVPCRQTQMGPAFPPAPFSSPCGLVGRCLAPIPLPRGTMAGAWPHVRPGRARGPVRVQRVLRPSWPWPSTAAWRRSVPSGGGWELRAEVAKRLPWSVARRPAVPDRGTGSRSAVRAGPLPGERSAAVRCPAGCRRLDHPVACRTPASAVRVLTASPVILRCPASRFVRVFSDPAGGSATVSSAWPSLWNFGVYSVIPPVCSALPMG